MTFSPMKARWTEGWSLEHHDGWVVTNHPECLTLELNGEGALQLSSATKTTGDVTWDDIREMMDEHPEHWGEAQPSTCGDFSGVVYEYQEDGAAWRRWYVRNGRTFILITHNADPDAFLGQRDAVDRVLATLQADD